jgi:hypothetical protein
MLTTELSIFSFFSSGLENIPAVEKVVHLIMSPYCCQIGPYARWIYELANVIVGVYFDTYGHIVFPFLLLLNWETNEIPTLIFSAKRGGLVSSPKLVFKGEGKHISN